MKINLFAVCFYIFLYLFETFGMYIILFDRETKYLLEINKIKLESFRELISTFIYFVLFIYYCHQN